MCGLPGCLPGRGTRVSRPTQPACSSAAAERRNGGAAAGRRKPSPGAPTREIPWGRRNGDRVTAIVDEAGGPARRLVGVLVTVAALVWAADVISKVIVVATLSENAPVPVIGLLLRLDYIRNPGAD